MAKGRREHFLQRWKKSLKRKALLYPDTYPKKQILKHDNLRELTTYLVDRYTEYDDLYDYIYGYAVVGDTLKNLHIPSEMVLNEDDPIIPIKDQSAIATSSSLSIHTNVHGGHCGFLTARLHTPWTNHFVDWAIEKHA